jgi:hypothetical protein
METNKDFVEQYILFQIKCAYQAGKDSEEKVIDVILDQTKTFIKINIE